MGWLAAQGAIMAIGLPVSICGQAFFLLGLNRNNSLYSAARQRKLPSGSLAIWIR